MTNRPTDDPLPRDPRFDAAWSTVSNEEPSPALDATILAAAHREVGAKPQSLAAQAAVRARRRWWPLAAAATVAVIAIGVVQRAGHDDLVPLPSGSTVVSDMPTQPTKSVEESPERTDAQRRAAPSAPVPLQKKAEPFAAAPAPSEKKSEPTRAAPAPSEKKSEPTSDAPAPAPEPFPAGKAKLDAAAARDAAPGTLASRSARDTDTGRAAPVEEQAARQPAQRQVPPANSAPIGPIAERAAESSALQRSEGGAASAKLVAPPMPSPAAPMPAAAAFADGTRASAPAGNRVAPLAGPGTVGAAENARSKDRMPLPVADWIALIRRLRAEGNSAEAARELAAFRTAHADHEKLLPPDLRDWHPAEK